MPMYTAFKREKSLEFVGIDWLNVAATVALALLAIGLLYVVGFAPMAVAHDSFHDVRHAFGFPCH